MVRTIIGTLGVMLGFALAVASVVVLIWLLWKLWSSRQEEAVAAIELPLSPEPSSPEPPAAAEDEDVTEETGEAGDTPQAPEAPPEPDDLKRIEGIGPKISSVLQEAGITTFAQLAEAEVGQIEEILEEADPRLKRLANPASWPEQAALASAGQWEALEALQNGLKGGRRV
jgi:predicted flap endonuclease-1-like 5' DNA nuclease